jgi:hypothetical protein
MEFGAGKRMRPLAFVNRVAAAVLHPEQLLLALVEFMVADRGEIEPHHRHGFDGRLVVKHRRQKRARADQVARRDERRVLMALAQALHDARHGLRPAGRHHDLPGLVIGIGDPDSAGRRHQIAVEIIDRENAQLDRRGIGESARRDRKRDHGGRQQRESTCHAPIIKRRRDDFTKLPRN